MIYTLFGKKGKGKQRQADARKKLIFDDGIQKYEIEFVEGLNEYEYDIDPKTGAILKVDKD